MTRRAYISGSVAFDTIMVFDGHFKDHILPDRVHMLNVSFLTPRLKREFGGCAANIAYNLQALGGRPVVLATVGHDAGGYVQRLRDLGIDVARMLALDDEFTAQCFITTDLSDNQITAFHPGAMSYAHRVEVPAEARGGLGIVSPNGKEAMLAHARGFRDHGVEFIFDPGQGLPMFDGDELRALIDAAGAVTVNDYESSLLCERTGLTESQLVQRVRHLIITRGGEGSQVWVDGVSTHVAPVAIAQAVDPTGCGDAYRGGLLYGLAHAWDWVAAARLGSVMGAIKIEQQGAQNHRIDRALVAQRYAEAYGTRPW